MKITVICVGKLKEKFYREAVEEYVKRLSRYCKLELIEVADEKTPEGASELEEEKILEREADRILGKIREDAFVCALEIKGRKLSSEGLAEWIQCLTVEGTSHITFVIGGSLGLHSSVRKRADFSLSFSNMTFPHQLMRVILLEQIYRSFRIINSEPYHK